MQWPRSRKPWLRVAREVAGAAQVSLLLEHGANATALDASGNTAAKLAALAGRSKSKELLTA